MSRVRSRPRLLESACAAAILAAPASAWGAPPKLGANGAPLDTSGYTIDFYEGPVLAGARIIGLAGAYAPIAEGIAGYRDNPASAAVRVPYSTGWFDWELDAGFTLPSSITGTDFDNNGSASFAKGETAFFLTGGVGFQFGALGAGLTLDFRRYQVRSLAGKGSLRVNVIRPLLVTAYSFLGGQIIVGAGIGLNYIDIGLPVSGAADRTLAQVPGIALHIGALWAPHRLPLRMGASVRFAPSSDDPRAIPSGIKADPDGNYVSQGLYLPRNISLPIEAHAGIAVQLFRQMNFPWINPHDEDSSTRAVEQAIRDERARRKAAGVPRSEEQVARTEEQKRLAKAKADDRARRLLPYKTMRREKILISADVKITGPTRDGVGEESFLRQVVERSGETTTFSPRLGVEGEAWPGYLVLRAGTYYEPTRFRNANSAPRVHGTGGLDIRIPIAWSVFGLLDDDTTFRVGGAVDGAARYFGWSVTAGIWR